MPDKIYLKPGKGRDGQPLRVVDPATLEPLPLGGKAVVLTTGWRRRLRDGDVEKLSAEEIKALEKKQKEDAAQANADDFSGKTEGDK